MGRGLNIHEFKKEPMKTKPQEIRHRRLYAFFNNKVLNVLSLIVIVSLTQIGYLREIIGPTICAAFAFALGLGYGLWFWIKKPKKIIINRWISDRNIWFTLYFLVVTGFQWTSMWVCLAPILAAILLLFLNLLRPKDELFEI